MRQRAVICQDCWFWREMSCALPNPVGETCANKRPVAGRAGTRAGAPAQAPLVPLAEGHARVETPAAAAAAVARAGERAPAAEAEHRFATSEPFAADAPESTFSIGEIVPSAPVARVTPPPFTEVRAAAARARATGAELRIEVPPRRAVHGTMTIPGMEELAARVRRRAAERLSRNGVQLVEH